MKVLWTVSNDVDAFSARVKTYQQSMQGVDGVHTDVEVHVFRAVGHSA